MKWLVKAKITLEHYVDAGTKEEAERIANDKGDMYADFVWKGKKDGTYWMASRIK